MLFIIARWIIKYANKNLPRNKEFSLCEVNRPMLWVTIQARSLLAKAVWTAVCVLCASMDCGVCSVRQCGLWCVFCASVWTVVCVLCASMDCGVCSVRQCELWCVFCAPVFPMVCVLCARFCTPRRTFCSSAVVSVSVFQLRNCSVDVD